MPDRSRVLSSLSRMTATSDPTNRTTGTAVTRRFDRPLAPSPTRRPIACRPASLPAQHSRIGRVGKRRRRHRERGTTPRTPMNWRDSRSGRWRVSSRRFQRKSSYRLSHSRPPRICRATTRTPTFPFGTRIAIGPILRPGWIPTMSGREVTPNRRRSWRDVPRSLRRQMNGQWERRAPRVWPARAGCATPRRLVRPRPIRHPARPTHRSIATSNGRLPRTQRHAIVRPRARLDRSPPASRLRPEGDPRRRRRRLVPRIRVTLVRRRGSVRFAMRRTRP